MTDAATSPADCSTGSWSGRWSPPTPSRWANSNVRPERHSWTRVVVRHCWPSRRRSGTGRRSTTTSTWVAEIDGAAVGYLHLHHPQGSPTGHVRQVYLDPEAREVGFGDELLAAAIARLRERGATAVESWALPGDRDTKNLFERAGVTARKLVVSKRIV
ncbi:MAG: GNAT family N-acetyltransferase [Ilumatobacteraceae bacterium]